MKSIIKYDIISFFTKNMKIMVLYLVSLILTINRCKTTSTDYLFYLKYDNFIDIINLLFLLFNILLSAYIPLFIIYFNKNSMFKNRIKQMKIMISKILAIAIIIVAFRILILICSYLFIKQIFNPLKSIIIEFIIAIIVIVLFRKQETK
ncbi:MAG: hypothetical protein RRY22_00635 [Bacilli bacterium]